MQIGSLYQLRRSIPLNHWYMFTEEGPGVGSDHEYQAGSTWIYIGDLHDGELRQMKSLQDGLIANLGQDSIDSHFSSIE